MKKEWTSPKLDSLETKITEKSSRHGNNVDATFVQDETTTWFSYSN